MRKHFRIWLIALALWAGSVMVVLADFQAGVEAYESGDYGAAFREFRLSAEQGLAEAQLNLGVMYDYGRGVAQDYKEAVRWFQAAAEQGYTRAQSLLGVMYGNGRGVLNDNVTAHMWFSIAAANGSKTGSDNRVIIEKKMTPSQIAEAQKMAREWMKKHP